MRDFATLGMSPLYAEMLSPIFRCKLCNHLFAPRTEMVAASNARFNVPVANGSSY